MDVQTENMDPPSSESQSSGKIRKGFKLFGKRKPGNIFSIRSKGDGNNKSPVNKGKSLEGLSESAAPDSEQEPDKEKGQEVSQGEMEQPEEEALGEDGVRASAHARPSISSASSAKSLSFLSLLRGGRRGVGDRRVQTVSQPTGRQRRGIKGLFGNVKFRSRDKEDKEETPPSPLLMLSRANSVEIIKEDLTLTPKFQLRSLDSPETDSCEFGKSSATQDSAATTPSETVAPPVTADTVSRSNEHVPPLPTSEPPLVPGDNSLSCLLADISSLLTFDSISGGGDIMADVEAEWGKASSAIGAVEITPLSTSLFSKPSVSSPLSSVSVSTVVTGKPSPVAIPTIASTKPIPPLTKTTLSSPPITKPSTIITTLTKSSTLTTQSVKLSSDSAPASQPFTGIIKSTPALTVGKPSTTPVTITSVLSPIMSSPSITINSTRGSTSSFATATSTTTTATAPPNTPATVVKVPSVSSTLTSTASKLTSETAAPPQMAPSVSKPSTVAPTKTLPVTHGPPTPIAPTPPAKFDSVGNLNLKTSTSYKPPLSLVTGECKAPVTVPSTFTFTTKPPSPAPLTTTTGLASAILSKPTLTSTPIDLNQTTPSLTSPNLCTSFRPTAKTQPSTPSVPAPSATSLDKVPPLTKPTPIPVSIDKISPAPITTTHAVVSTAAPTPAPLGQISISQSKVPAAPAQISISASKESFSQMHVSQSKTAPAPVQISVSASKDSTPPAQKPVSVLKDPFAPAQIPISEPRGPFAPDQISISASKESFTQMHVSHSKTAPAPIQIPVSVSKDSTPPAQIPISVPRGPPAPDQIEMTMSKDSPHPTQGVPQVLHSKVPSTAAQIPVAVPKISPAPCPVIPLTSTPAPYQTEALISAKMRASGQASVDGQLSSPGSTEAPGLPFKTDEQQNESRTSLQGLSRDKRTPQAKPSGLSKIPIVGGGRPGKIPVREAQHDEEASRDPPTPVQEEVRYHFNSHGSRDKLSDVEVTLPTSKHSQEERQQPKVLTSLQRDSKIPVKHGAGSQIPQAKEPPRTKIPVSKVPVRRVGNKPAAAGGSSQIRK